jgi:DNA-directed RNA polymerase subunit RPC12/RpoP
MKPASARLLMILLISAVAIAGIAIVNSVHHGSLVVGLLLIVLPVLVLSFSLPHLLPVRCPRCNGKMRFRFAYDSQQQRHFYSYACVHCANRHEWEGSSSTATLDN